MDEVTRVFAEWANLALTWIGFGTLVGLLAKAVFPGKDPGGALPTVIIGVLGSVIGAGCVLFFTGLKVQPISVVGLPVAILGTAVILACYRLLQGKGFGPRIAFLKWKKPSRRQMAVVDE